MSDEFSPLLPRDSELQIRLQTHRRHGPKWLLGLTLTCVIFSILLFAVGLYLGFSGDLVDEKILGPHYGVKCSFPASKAAEFTPPLRSKGRHILDSRNETIRLKSVNWYGASDIRFVPSGLDIRHRDEISSLVRCMGFNSVRLPYSDEMAQSNPLVPLEQVMANPDLIGSRALDVYSAVVQSLTSAGISVIVNNHITQATWCCGMNLCDTAWANDWLGHICRVRQTEAGWIENWQTIMQPFINNSLVVGADLRNEVRGLWGTMYWDSWAAVAERAAEALLRMNEEWLMIVEGVSSANDLSGVKSRPIQLSIPGRVVYSAHVYSWSGWGQLAPYSTTTYQAFAKAMRKNWAYLLEEDLAAVLVGEFGTPDRPTYGDLNYWKHLMQLLTELDAGWSYWAINPRKPAGNESEGYGLLADDWETVRWDYRTRDLLRLGLYHGQLNRSEQA
jgi:endoglucanase